MSEWTLQFRVRDFGPWKPDEPAAAAALIASVNAERGPGDPKAKLSTDWDGNRLLTVHLTGDHITLDPGEHLLRCTSDRRTWLASMSADELADFRPVMVAAS